jgi:Gly-Xaa carboxypeptidase
LSPIHEGLICFAKYSPDVLPPLTDSIENGDLNRAAQLLAQVQRETQYFIQTSQAVNRIAGGQKINSLPEFTALGVNHRYAPQDSIGGIQHRIVDLVQDTIQKYNLTLEAFEGDEDYEDYLHSLGQATEGRNNSMQPTWDPVYNGKLRIESRKKSYITPQSPTKGSVWDTFSGTVRHTFAQKGKTVVFAPGAMTGNTDTRHYLSKSSQYIQLYLTLNKCP